MMIERKSAVCGARETEGVLEGFGGGGLTFSLLLYYYYSATTIYILSLVGVNNVK